MSAPITSESLRRIIRSGALNREQYTALLELLDRIGIGISVVDNADPGYQRCARSRSWDRVAAQYARLLATVPR